MDRYTWDIATQSETVVNELVSGAGLTRPTAIVLANRGIDSTGVQGFLNPALRDLGDPYLLPGTLDAAKRLWQAILNGEKILIHGDYDTDGITAAALVSWVLRSNGADTTCYLPHRIDDGYGLTEESIEKACEENCHLLLTVDCGITSYDAAREARRRNLDLIITDHHTPGSEPLDADVVVDPKLPGSPPSCQDLAGVGVAFKVCHAFIKYGRQQGIGGDEIDLKQGLDLVALGTVADIVPLIHENRLLVRHGLDVLARQQRPGIHALCEMAGVNDRLLASDITYRLAPRLNATGRMGDPTESLRLLEADSMVDAFTLARTLDECNRQRQQIEEDAVQGAEEQIASTYDLQSDRAIVVWNDEWHQGVVGIVASRLTRRYHRPSVVLTLDSDGQYTGSARSIKRLNLVSLLEQCSDSLVRFGGHAMAAGLSLDAPMISRFRKDFERAVRRVLGVEAMHPQLDICGTVGFSELDDRFFGELDLLQPFGHSNPEPVFIVHNATPERCGLVGRSHTRGVLRDTNGGRMPFIAFRRLPDDLPAPPWDVVYTPQMNHFNGRSTPQAKIIDLRSS